MKTRAEIKTMAKESFRGRYWFCVGVVVLYWVVTMALGYTGVGSLILGGPILIGLNFVMINVFMGSPCDVGTMFTKAFEDFGRKLGGYLWMTLFLFLWSLLLFAFVIPGVVMIILKGYAYAMTPYILSDCPNVKAQDALKLSMRMMKGHKWELFVFQLSFIGWQLLNALTMGILGIFWVGPYQQISTAGWYLELREECLRQGVITTDELDGGPLMEPQA